MACALHGQHSTSFQNLRSADSALCCGGAAARDRGGPGGGAGERSAKYRELRKREDTMKGAAIPFSLAAKMW